MFRISFLTLQNFSHRLSQLYNIQKYIWFLLLLYNVFIQFSILSYSSWLLSLSFFLYNVQRVLIWKPVTYVYYYHSLFIHIIIPMLMCHSIQHNYLCICFIFKCLHLLTVLPEQFFFHILPKKKKGSRKVLIFFYKKMSSSKSHLHRHLIKICISYKFRDQN